MYLFDIRVLSEEIDKREKLFDDFWDFIGLIFMDIETNRVDLMVKITNNAFLWKIRD